MAVSLASCFHAADAATQPLTTKQEHARKLGDELQYAIPLSALALTFAIRPNADEMPQSHFDADTFIHLDGTRRHDLFLALGRAFVITEALKYSVEETRPNGGSKSFPSGHTAVAFTGAEFIRKEYGWWWGGPAYAAAGYVAWSRVDAHEHHTRDVVAAALIGMAVNHDLREMKTRFGLLSVTPKLLTVDDNSRARSSAAPVVGLNVSLRR